MTQTKVNDQGNVAHGGRLVNPNDVIADDVIVGSGVAGQTQPAAPATEGTPAAGEAAPKKRRLARAATTGTDEVTERPEITRTETAGLGAAPERMAAGQATVENEERQAPPDAAPAPDQVIPGGSNAVAAIRDEQAPAPVQDGGQLDAARARFLSGLTPPAGSAARGQSATRKPRQTAEPRQTAPEQKAASPARDVSQATAAAAQAPATEPSPPAHTEQIEATEAPELERYSQLPEDMFNMAQKRQREYAKAKLKERDPGSAISGTLEGDTSLDPREVAVPALQLYRAYQNPSSAIRALLAQDESIDPAKMLLEEYAIPRIIEFFAKNDVPVRAQKDPITSEADAHIRIVRAYDGDAGVRISSLVFEKYNADFDGDPMQITFDKTAIEGVKGAMDHLVDSANVGKISPAFFGLVPWGDLTAARNRIKTLLVKFAGERIPVSTEEIDGMAEALVEAWGGDVDAGFRSMLRWCRVIGERSGPENRDRITAEVLMRIYRQNREIALMRTSVSGVLESDYVTPVNENDTVVQDGPVFPDHIVAPGNDANLFDTLTRIKTPFGTVDRKNPLFRIISGLGKMSRQRMELFGVEVEKVGVTSEDIVSLAMSGVERLDESTRNVAMEARRSIFVAMRRFGNGGSTIVPADSPEAFQEWLTMFAEVHNNTVFAFNVIAGELSLDMKLKPYDDLMLPEIPMDDSPESRKVLRTQFRNVYGGFTMKQIFGKEAPSGYKNMTLDEFIETNNLYETGTSETPYDTPEQFIGRLADLRTSFAHEFRNLLLNNVNGRYYGALVDMMDDTMTATKLKVMLDKREKMKESGESWASVALDEDIATLTEAIYLLSPEVFDFLGMSTPAALVASPLGMKFVDAKSPDELGGVLLEAQARYRLAKAQRHLDAAVEADTAGEMLVAQKHHMRYEQEIKSLASSSTTWTVLIDRYQSGHDDINEILFADKGLAVKEKEIRDIVRNHHRGRRRMQSYEVASELFANPKGPYRAQRFSDNLGHSALKKSIRSARTVVDRHAKASWDHCHESVVIARSNTPSGTLMEFLTEVARDPGTLSSFEPWMMVDAILSNLERSYDSTEKNSQEAECSFLYMAVCSLLNGGVFSDLSVGADFGLGKVALDRFQNNPAMLARIFSNPDFSITVYSGDKEIRVDRELLLAEVGGETVEEQIWSWMERYPRAAMALRKHGVTNNNKYNGATATMSIGDTIASTVAASNNPARHKATAIRKLADHPGFYAMVSLAVPISGQKRYQLRDRTEKTIVTMLDFVTSFSGEDVDTLQYVREMFEAAGYDMAKVDAAYDAGQSATEALATASSEDIRDSREYHVGQMYHRLADDLRKYSGLLGTIGGLAPVKRMTPAEAAENIFQLNDEGSLRSYFDTIQVMSSVKTEVSTSINGLESQRNAVLMLVASYIGATCDVDPVEVPVDDFMRDWTKYRGMKVKLPTTDLPTPVDETNWERIARESGDAVHIYYPANCKSRVFPCKLCATADPSTNLRPGSQTPALGRFLTIVRTLSSEGLNLKSKTLGDDGSDSIAKFRLFDVIRHDIQEEASRRFAQGGEPAVRTWLAGVLKENFSRLGYKDELTLADFTNIAHILVRPVEGEGGDVAGVNVLSIGQLNDIVKQAVTRARNVNDKGLTHDQAVGEAVLALARPVGELGVASVMAGFQVATQSSINGRIRPGLSAQRSASIARNNMMVERILTENPSVKRVSEKALDEWAANETLVAAAGRWSEFTATGRFWKPGQPRNAYRVIGSLDKDGKWVGTRSVGFKNAWVIDIRADKAPEAVAQAYQLGLTVFLEGSLTKSEQDDFWDKTASLTGNAVDAHQGLVIDAAHRLIPMFDIRLNGGNTTLDTGTVNAGTFWSRPDSIYFYFENALNELGLGDSEFAPYKWFVNTIRPRRSGDYRVNTRVLLADLFAEMEARRRQEPGPTTKAGTKLTGTQSPAHDEQAQKFADRATKFIGRGTEGSFANQCAVDFGTRANSGHYQSNDMVYVEVDIKRPGGDGPDFAEIILAADDGASFLMDTSSPLTNGVKDILRSRGYVKKGDALVPGKKHAINRWSRDDIRVTVATKQEVMAAFGGKNGKIPLIYTGLDIADGSDEDIMLREGTYRFFERINDVNDEGWLQSARPGEIIGWLRIDTGDEVAFSPIRPFETGNAGGAPNLLTVTNVLFDTGRNDLVVKWEHSGTMEGRQFKIFEALYGANKYMARSKAEDDVTLMNGVKIAGQIAQASTLSRRLYMRRRQKMMTVMYMSRIAPYGYNMAEKPSSFPRDTELKARLLDGSATIEDWSSRLKADGGIRFYPDTPAYADMNTFATQMAETAIKCGINPTDVFASRFTGEFGDKVPSNIWFNFQVLFGDGPLYQAGFMNFLADMMPTLVPGGQDYREIGDTFKDRSDTLFNKDLQVLVPIPGRNEKRWVDLYGGFHFLDEHYSGYSGAGVSTIQPNSLPTMNTLMAGGYKLTPRDVDLYLDWANAGSSRNTYAMPYMMLPESTPDIDID